MNKKCKSMVVVFVCCALMGLMTACQSPAASQPPASATPARETASAPEATLPLPPSPPPTHPPLPSETAALTPTPGADEIRAAVVNALWARNTQPNRMQCKSVLEDGSTQNYLTEFKPPDRKYVIYYDQDVAYIVVGDEVYIKEGGGEWQKTDLPAANFMRNIEETKQEISDSLRQVQQERRDTLDGKGMVVFSYNSVSMYNDIELSSQTELWVGEADGLAYQLIIDGEIAASRNNPETGESEAYAARTLTTCTLEFDSTISIEPPG